MSKKTQHSEVIAKDPINPTTVFYRMTVTKIVGLEDTVESYEQASVDRVRSRVEDGNVLVGIVGHQLHAIHESDVVSPL